VTRSAADPSHSAAKRQTEKDSVEIGAADLNTQSNQTPFIGGKIASYAEESSYRRADKEAEKPFAASSERARKRRPKLVARTATRAGIRERQRAKRHAKRKESVAASLSTFA